MGIFICLPLFKLQFILGKNIGKSSIYKNQPKKSLRQFFQVTQRLITDQTESTGLPTIDWQQLMWRETTLLCDRAVQIANSQTCVFSDSVLCLGGISTEPVKAWKDRIKWFSKIWIESVENKWNSSGKISQDSLRCTSSTRFER